MLDAITSGRVRIVVNTAQGGRSARDGSYIRRAAIRSGTAYNTTVAAAVATVEAIRAAGTRPGGVKALKDYYKMIRK